MLLTNGNTYVGIIKSNRGLPQGLSDWYLAEMFPSSCLAFYERKPEWALKGGEDIC